MTSSVVIPLSIKAGFTAVTNLCQAIFTDRAKRKSADLADYKLNPPERSIESYVKTQYESAFYINTIVFQNEKKRLCDLYVPLTLKNENTKKTYLIDENAQAFLDKYHKSLVLDKAGMGKSTILRFFFLLCCHQSKYIPVLIDFRDITPEIPLVEFIHTKISSIGREFDRELFLALLEEGAFFFFFDGFDEISEVGREKIINSVQSFFDKASSNRFIATSRPDSPINCFQAFDKFTITPLKQSEAFDLIKKYDPNDHIATRLIGDLTSDKHRNISEFLANPLLTSLLFKAYEFKPKLEFKRSLFYRQVYDALYEQHDFSKPGFYKRKKDSSLNSDDFHRVLRAVGYLTIEKNNLSFSKDQLLQLFLDSNKYLPGLKFVPSELYNDLTKNVPLFFIDGLKVQWAHKSIAEYFYGCFVCLETKSRQPEYMRNIVDKVGRSGVDNILEICYDIDYELFRHVLIKDCLSDFIKIYSHLRGIYTNLGFPDSDLGKRASLMLYQRNRMVVCDEVHAAGAEKFNIFEYVNKIQPNVLQQEFISGGISQGNLRTIPIDDSSGNSVIVFCGFEPRFRLFSFLAQKHPELFITGGGQTRLKAVQAPIKCMPRFDMKEKTMYKITNDPAEFYNKNGAFQIINNAIDQYGITMDPSACQKMLDDIHEEIRVKEAAMSSI